MLIRLCEAAEADTRYGRVVVAGGESGPAELEFGGTDGLAGIALARVPSEAIRSLERHPHSSEAFAALEGEVVVLLAPAGPVFDPAEVIALRLKRPLMIVLHPGVWHSNLYAVRGTARCAWVLGSPADTETVWLAEPLTTA